MKKIEIESDGTMIIPCTCNDKNCTSFLYVRPNNDVDVVFYGQRQFTIGVPPEIAKAMRKGARVFHPSTSSPSPTSGEPAPDASG